MKLFITLIFLYSFTLLHAQEFGGFPPSTKWMQINTDTARIIFQPAAKLQAERIAAILHRMAEVQNTLGGEQKKINIILHSRTTLANGFVSLAPFRSEFYLVPGSNIFEFGNLPWNEQLVVHEYRHVMQFNNFNHGLSKFAGIILGQQGRALANSMAIPDWFFEGDAVYSETVNTLEGRGRTPWFFNGFTSLWKEGRNYSWMKLRNGSLKDMVPNHYPLGYLLVNYGYEKYGPDFWKKVTRDASAYRGLIYPFQTAIKKYSAVDFKTFRNQAFAYYNHETSKRRDDQRRRETVSNYYFPQVIGEDSLLYLKDSYRALPAFYIRDKNGEHKIALRNISSEDWISYRNGTIAYTMYNTHPKWSLVDYSDVVLLDIASGKQEQITHKGKYYTPDLSPDGKQIVVVSINDSLQSELQFLDRDGKLLKKRKAPVGAIFVQPRFIDSTSVIVGIRQPTAKISIHRLDLQTMKFEQLVMATRATSGFFFPYKGRVYFTSSLNGSDDIYALHLSDRTVWQITSGGVGHYYPSIHGNQLTWSQFTANGLRIMQKPLDSLERIELDPGAWGNEQVAFPVANGDSAENLLTTPLRDFAVTKYKKGTGLFNVHSWRPYYEDPEFSFTVYSDNVLNNFSNSVYYRYNQNESSHTVGFNSAYGGFFPVINAGVERIMDRHVGTSLGTVVINQTEARIGYSIPLDFTKGKTIKRMLLGSDFVYNSTEPGSQYKNIIEGYNSTYLHHYFTWAHQLPSAAQQIYPHLGYAMATHLRHRLDEYGYQALGNAAVFLPGIFKNHSLVLTGGLQFTDTANTLFSNHFANSRGYRDYYYSKMWRYSVNYHFPIAYPDFGLANIVYFLRVRANIFYDDTYALNKKRTTRYEFRTAGSELYFDTKWWNMLPVSFGVRYSYLLDADKFHLRSPHVFELVVPVNLIPD
jgi:hypothetical protein